MQPGRIWREGKGDGWPFTFIDCPTSHCYSHCYCQGAELSCFCFLRALSFFLSSSLSKTPQAHRQVCARVWCSEIKWGIGVCDVLYDYLHLSFHDLDVRRLSSFIIWGERVSEIWTVATIRKDTRNSLLSYGHAMMPLWFLQNLLIDVFLVCLCEGHRLGFGGDGVSMAFFAVSSHFVWRWV
jgi:hypothetical protein